MKKIKDYIALAVLITTLVPFLLMIFALQGMGGFIKDVGDELLKWFDKVVDVFADFFVDYILSDDYGKRK